MKTKIHTIKGASLSNIEALAGYGEPDWVPHIVAIAGTETSALDEAMVETQHYSGLLRSCSNFSYVDAGKIEDEDGNMHNIEDLLDGAAERLDQAHEEWLESEHSKWERPTLDIEVRNVYGIDRFYPANDKAREMADMLGRKTLNQEDLIRLNATFNFEIRLTNAVAHEWLRFATSKLEVTS